MSSQCSRSFIASAREYYAGCRPWWISASSRRSLSEPRSCCNLLSSKSRLNESAGRPLHLQHVAHHTQVIVYLAGKSISAVKFDGARPSFGGYTSGEIKVGTLLNLFSPSFGESIENRKRFGKNGPLVKNGFIIIHSPRSYCSHTPKYPLQKCRVSLIV